MGFKQIFQNNKDVDITNTNQDMGMVVKVVVWGFVVVALGAVLIVGAAVGINQFTGSVSQDGVTVDSTEN